MGRPVVVQVGALVAASATKIALAQTVPAAGALALNGGAGTFTANNIALSQTLGSATTVTLNGALAQGTPAVAYPSGGVGPIYITSAGDDSGITFALVGTDKTGLALQTETLTGSNTSVVASSKNYSSILSITSSGATTAAITVGTFLPVKLDKARRVIFTSGGNDSARTITISGTSDGSSPISETLAGASGAAASTVLDYLTIAQVKIDGATATTLSVGTNGVAASPWIRGNEWAATPTVLQCDKTGTVNYTVQFSADDPNSPTNAVAPAAMAWFSSTDTGVVGVTASAASSFAYTPTFIRVLLNSGSGSVSLTAVQYGGMS